jgi:hypothetical protein
MFTAQRVVSPYLETQGAAIQAGPFSFSSSFLCYRDPE